MKGSILLEFACGGGRQQCGGHGRSLDLALPCGPVKGACPGLGDFYEPQARARRGYALGLFDQKIKPRKAQRPGPRIEPPQPSEKLWDHPLPGFSLEAYTSLLPPDEAIRLLNGDRSESRDPIREALLPCRVAHVLESPVEDKASHLHDRFDPLLDIAHVPSDLTLGAPQCLVDRLSEGSL